MFRELSNLEVNAVAGGFNLDGYRYSENVGDMNTLKGYREAIDLWVARGIISDHQGNELMAERLRQEVARIMTPRT